MGTDYHYHICHRTKDNKWEEVCLYSKNRETGEFEPVYISYGRNHSLYKYLHEREMVKKFSVDCAAGTFKELLEDRFPKNKDFTGYFDLEYVNFADLQIFVYKNPCIKYDDYDEYNDEDYDDNYMIDNPLTILIKDVEKYIDLATDSYDSAVASDYSIVMYCDC